MVTWSATCACGAVACAMDQKDRRFRHFVVSAVVCEAIYSGQPGIASELVPDEVVDAATLSAVVLFNKQLLAVAVRCLLPGRLRKQWAARDSCCIRGRYPGWETN